MMDIKLYATLLIIITAFQGLNLQSTGVPCTAEEVSIIIEENTDLITEKCDNSNSAIQKRLSDVKNQLVESLASSPATKALNELEQTILNLEPSECSKLLQSKFDPKKLKIKALQSKCSAQSSKKILGAESKINAALKKLQSTKNSTNVQLQKCSLKNSKNGCSAVEFCIQLAMVQINYKIDISTIKLGGDIGKVVSEQNNCLQKITKEALELQEDIEEDIIECIPKVPDSDGSDDSHKSKESSESGESSESKSGENSSSTSDEKVTISTKPEEQVTVSTKTDEEVTESTNTDKQTTANELPERTEPPQTKTTIQDICNTISENEDTTSLIFCPPTPVPTTDRAIGTTINDLDVITEEANTETELEEVPESDAQPGKDENAESVDAR